MRLLLLETKHLCYCQSRTVVDDSTESSDYIQAGTLASKQCQGVSPLCRWTVFSTQMLESVNTHNDRPHQMQLLCISNLCSKAVFSAPAGSNETVIYQSKETPEDGCYQTSAARLILAVTADQTSVLGWICKTPTFSAKAGKNALHAGVKFISIHFSSYYIRNLLLTWTTVRVRVAPGRLKLWIQSGSSTNS